MSIPIPSPPPIQASPENRSTITEFDNSKQPERSPALAPTCAPERVPSCWTCHIKHLPSPRDSKLKTVVLFSIMRIVRFSSVSKIVCSDPIPPAICTCTSSSSSSSIQTDTMVSPSIVLIVDAITSHVGGGGPQPSSFNTSIELERSKHPSSAPALAPISAPLNPSSKLRCHIKQTPGA